MESYLSHHHPQSYVSVRPIRPVPSRTSGTVLWNPTCPTNTLNPMYPFVLSHLSHVGQVGQSYGILPVPQTPCVRPVPPVPSRTSDSPTESYLSHQHPQSYVSVHPIPPVPCRTSGTVLWNPSCPTIILNPMYPSVLSDLSQVGQVVQSYGILPVPPTPSILCIRSSYPTCPM